MRVLVVGSGGREHALAWALAASPLLTALFVAPGNPGTAAFATNVGLTALDIAGLARFAKAERIDLVVPGPEGPLVAGLTDAMAAAGVRCCGPSRAAAQLEGSKAFTKGVCEEAGIPTARWERFEEREAALAFVRLRGAPLVVKADGLAAGKGVVVAETLEEAEAAVEALMRLGPVVIEERMVGPERSLFALCDGVDAVFLGVAQDHKRVGDGDVGPNTGGMGAFSPAEGFDVAGAMDVFIRPALRVMKGRGTPFRGVLFAGLMLTGDGMRLVEYNVRFGDPECQALLPRLRSDLLPAFVAACEGELGTFDLRWREDAHCVAVVMAANGYPAAPREGTVIDGLEAAATVPGALIFQAGTRVDGPQLLAAGGRVLTVVGTGADRAAARAAAYEAISHIRWPGGFCRGDIGVEG